MITDNLRAGAAVKMKVKNAHPFPNNSGESPVLSPLYDVSTVKLLVSKETSRCVSALYPVWRDKTGLQVECGEEEIVKYFCCCCIRAKSFFFYSVTGKLSENVMKIFCIKKIFSFFT